MTKAEQARHKLLVEELKTRRTSGETNIVIRGNSIITYKPKSPGQTTVTYESETSPMEMQLS